MAALDKIFDLLDTEPDLADKPDAIDPRPLRGEIELEQVWFSYAPITDTDDDRWAMKDVSIEIPGRVRRSPWSARPAPEVDAGEAGRPLLRPADGAGARRRPRPA